jgi:hypothetical protein
MKLKPIDPKDFAYLQGCVEALNERVNMLEAENARLRSMWGGCNSRGEPCWAAFKAPVLAQAGLTTGRDTITA